MFPLLRAGISSRERKRTRGDWHDRTVVVDGVDAILQHLLGDTGWIPSNSCSRPCPVGRMPFSIRLLTVMLEHRSYAPPSTKLKVDVQIQRYQLRREHVGHVRRGGAQQPASEGK